MLYVAGTNTFRDIYDGLAKVPFYGDLRNSARYQAVHDALMQNPQVTKLRGHSLGGSISLELQKNYPNLIKSTGTYGAPVLNLTGKDNGKVDRFRHFTQLVSIFDRSAKSTIEWNPFSSKSLTHGYDEIAGNFTSSKQIPGSSKKYDGTIF